MANNQMLTTRQVAVDYNAEYGYPATALVQEMGNHDYFFHVIFYGAAPSTDFAKAPNGSIIYDFVNGDVHQKRGTLGLTNGTWYKQAIATAE